MKVISAEVSLVIIVSWVVVSLPLLTVKEVALEAKTVRLAVTMMGGVTGILTIAAEKANKILRSVQMTK